MAIKKGKPNLHTILKRRRSSVEAYLSELGVCTSSELQNLVDGLRASYSITKEFETEAKLHLNKFKKMTKKAEIIPPVVEGVEELASIVEKMSTTSQKTSRTSKRSSKSQK